MGFIKSVFKRLLIAAVTGAIILAFVYYKDSYLEKGNSDMQLLNSVNVQKQSQEELMPTQQEEELKIEVVMPNTTTPMQEVQEPTYNVQEKEKIVQQAPTQAQSFEEYKRSMSFQSKDEAFEELERETSK